MLFTSILLHFLLAPIPAYCQGPGQQTNSTYDLDVTTIKLALETNTIKFTETFQGTPTGAETITLTSSSTPAVRTKYRNYITRIVGAVRDAAYVQTDLQKTCYPHEARLVPLETYLLLIANKV
jgi:hypothetical protein